MSTLDCVAVDGENEKLHFLLPPVEEVCVSVASSGERMHKIQFNNWGLQVVSSK